ncbi:MAG: hypothetical protein R2795_12250 [Saprospiraceae bacterium]
MIITYPNACTALCEGYTEADFVDCGNNGGCDCEPEWAPVCVSLEDGQIITFPILYRTLRGLYRSGFRGLWY